MSQDTPSRRIAAWDFDGTITERDTLGGFLVAFGGRRRFAASMSRRSAHLARGLRNDVARDRAKELVIGDIVSGHTVAAYEAAGREYASLLDRRCRAASMDRVAQHRADGDELVIVSASLETYLRPFAEAHGFAHVIGVTLAERDGVLTGEFARPNVRAEQKASRLQEWINETGGGPAEIWAYGNSSGDDHLLAMSDHPTWVGKRADRK